MSLPDQLQSCHFCPVSRAGVHVMHLQTMDIALHLSRKLAWRTHCLSILVTAEKRKVSRSSFPYSHVSGNNWRAHYRLSLGWP